MDWTYLYTCSLDQQYFDLLNLLAYLVGWWLPNFLLIMAYWLDWWPQRKIHSRDRLDSSLVVQALVSNLLGLVLITPLLSHFVLYPLFQDRVWEDVPGGWSFLCDTVVMWAWADGSFYWLHRLFHHPRLYWMHKQHHQFHQTIGLASTYAHPLELILVDGLSTYGFLLFYRPHIWPFILYLILRYEESVEEHSGYDLLTPWRLLRSTRHHEYHHSHNKGAYGTFIFWDRLMGTDQAYLGH